MSAFSGFPRDFLDFLSELSSNNNREWFAENKDRYKRSVVAPMSEFISAMDSRLAKVSDCFIADPRPNGGSMFRIYRDVRFSHDKRPYKEHVACHFRHISGKDAHAPGFYCHFEPNNVFFGGGIWRGPTPVLNDIRAAIDADQEQWKKATRGVAFKRRFGSVTGDGLKRPPRGFDEDHPLIEDLKRKSFFAVQHVDVDLVYTKDFVREVEKAFVALSPLMAFLTEAVGLTYSLDE